MSALDNFVLKHSLRGGYVIPIIVPYFLIKAKYSWETKFQESNK